MPNNKCRAAKADLKWSDHFTLMKLTNPYNFDAQNEKEQRNDNALFLWQIQCIFSDSEKLFYKLNESYLLKP